MTRLGNVLDTGDSGRPRGPDLHVTVEVPASAMGATDGFAAAVPVRIESDGALVKRALDGDSDRVKLFLPAQLPEGAVLRLRGQGGVRPDGVPGDLYVKVVVVRRSASMIYVGLLLLAGAAAATWWFTSG